MKKKRNNLGFTMAELLIVVAILVVLLGLAFVAVQSYQKSLKKLEYDTIAKEIFIAAQNHLTTAESQGYYGLSDDDAYGAQEGSTDVYYFYVEDGTATGGPDGGTTEYEAIFDMMLPFGSIDETVRMHGSYVIHYQKSTATILNVYYSDHHDNRFGISLATKVSFEDLSPDGYDGKLIGHFGDVDALQRGAVPLAAPTVTIHNEEKLWVDVSDSNTGSSLIVIVTGKQSGAMHKFTLKSSGSTGNTGQNSDSRRVVGTNIVVLDDITTSKLQFGHIVSNDEDHPFLPGEDIYVEAVAFDNTKLTNVAYSGKQTTNSLFKGVYLQTASSAGGQQEGEQAGEAPAGGTQTFSYTGVIENFRHLENLSSAISNFQPTNYAASSPLTKFEQVADLMWMDTSTASSSEQNEGSQEGTGDTSNGETADNSASAVPFLNQFATPAGSDPILPVTGDGYANVDAVTLYLYDETAASAHAYVPVSSTFNLQYEGNQHAVSNLFVDTNDDAGMFGALSNADISDLELVDVSINTYYGNAGALAGAISGTAAISNVVAYNTQDYDTGKKDSNSMPIATVYAPTSAGGLIGSLTGDGTVECCAAALTVGGSETATAGGLIGSTGTTTVTVNGCYSAGHTDEGEYYTHDTQGERVSEIYNVTGTTAGGLIGNAGNISIQHSYSTCSVSGGTTAGGFVGMAGVGSITSCYCTGLVSGTFTGDDLIHNAFVGNNPGEDFSFSGNKYFEIINEVPRRNENGKITEILYKGSGGSDESVHYAAVPFDDYFDTYEGFIAGPSSWTAAEPYDGELSKYYQEKYSLPNVIRLRAVLTTPVNESSAIPTDFYVNTHHGDWPAPEIFIINNP